ncbi:HAD family hydrolase [Streptococcus cameli]
MKALIFDVDDTLYDQVLPFERAIKDLVTLRDEDLVPLYKQFRHYSDLSFEDSVSGKLSMRDMHLYRMKTALADFGYTVSDEEALSIQDQYASYQEQLVLVDGAKAVFDWCQQAGIDLGIITNGPHLHQLNKVKSLQVEEWIASDKIIISGEVGMTKPNPAIFQLLEERLGMASEEICYVGDSFENDIVGAKGAGWQAVWLNHRHRQPSEPGIVADAVLDNMNQLLSWLKEKV